jgi:hypothetical protein
LHLEYKLELHLLQGQILPGPFLGLISPMLLKEPQATERKKLRSLMPPQRSVSPRRARHQAAEPQGRKEGTLCKACRPVKMSEVCGRKEEMLGK